MKPSAALELHRKVIRSIVEENHAANGKDTVNSDLDLLVDSTPRTTLFDISTIQFKLEELLKVPVDIVTPNALPKQFKTKVLQEAKKV